MRNEISTPVEQGTLVSRIIWDNDNNKDGIEVVLVHPNGDEETLYRAMSTEDGISCVVSLPVEDMNWMIEPHVTTDGDRCVLDLESGKEDR